MSQEILDLVRHVYEAWNSEGVEVLESWLTEDVELSDAPEMPDAHSYRGPAAVLGRLREVTNAVGGGWAELREFRDYGDTILVNMVWREEERIDSPAFADVTHLVRVRAGRISSLQVFLDRRAAELAARG